MKIVHFHYESELWNILHLLKLQNSILLLTCLFCVSEADEGFVEKQKRIRKTETNRTNEMMTMNILNASISKQTVGIELNRDEAFETLIDCSCLNLSIIVIDAFSFQIFISSSLHRFISRCLNNRNSLTFHHLLSTSNEWMLQIFSGAMNIKLTKQLNRFLLDYELTNKSVQLLLNIIER